MRIPQVKDLTFHTQCGNKGNDYWYISLQTCILQSYKLKGGSILLIHELLDSDTNSCIHLLRKIKIHLISNFHTELWGHNQIIVVFFRSLANYEHMSILIFQMAICDRIQGRDTKPFWSDTSRSLYLFAYLPSYQSSIPASNVQMSNNPRRNNIQLISKNGKTWFCISLDDRTLLISCEHYHSDLDRGNPFLLTQRDTNMKNSFREASFNRFRPNDSCDITWNYDFVESSKVWSWMCWDSTIWGVTVT